MLKRKRRSHPSGALELLDGRLGAAGEVVHGDRENLHPVGFALLCVRDAHAYVADAYDAVGADEGVIDLLDDGDLVGLTDLRVLGLPAGGGRRNAAVLPASDGA